MNQNQLRHRFSKRETKEIRKNLHDIEKKKNLSESKTKKIKNNFFELEKSCSRFRKNGNRDQDDIEYRGIRDVGNLFDKIDEDYYKPIKIKSAFNGNYIEYERKGNNDKSLSPKEYLNMIRT